LCGKVTKFSEYKTDNFLALIEVEILLFFLAKSTSTALSVTKIKDCNEMQELPLLISH
jgi:hypothetical protein